jgi:hypothetical protein
MDIYRLIETAPACVGARHASPWYFNTLPKSVAGPA